MTQTCVYTTVKKLTYHTFDRSLLTAFFPHWHAGSVTSTSSPHYRIVFASRGSKILINRIPCDHCPLLNDNAGLSFVD